MASNLENGPSNIQPDTQLSKHVAKDYLVLVECGEHLCKQINSSSIDIAQATTFLIKKNNKLL